MTNPYSHIEEISRDSNHLGVVRIPIEQDVPLSARVRAIVDTAEFRRLAQISQLALTSRIYPGATHTRFEHALGVYHNSLAYLWQLGKDERFAATVSDHDAEVLIVAALLHDIGHWPFCHPIEDLALPDMPPHEKFAGRFLGKDSELTRVLQQHWNVEPSEILDLLTSQSPEHSSRLRRSILSGPVDIDKMDYLQRDSQHCGVPYGRNFDRNRLMASLIVNEKGDGLAITTKGRTAAEMMVFARYVMFSEVYWHHAVRSATAMFARAFFEIRHRLDLSQLFMMNEPEMIRSLFDAADTNTERLMTGLFGSHRRLHKRLAEYSVYSQNHLYQSLRRMPYEDLVRCSNRLAELLGSAINEPVSETDVLIDAPPIHREVEFKVDVYDSRSQTWQKLVDVSPIVSAMSNTAFDDCVKRVRVFVAEPLIERLRKLPDLERLVQDAIDH
ncbi:MAG: HD domain-containing protein [Fuerstiella sp.]|nr:HD domain-containing protein [Fuerstiella sp.]